MLTVNKILQNYDSPEFQFRVCSQAQSFYDASTQELLDQPHISNHYYFYYLVKGKSAHQIDLNHLEILDGELLFICPNQVHSPQREAAENVFFKLYFEEHKQFLLKEHFAFLGNPFHTNQIRFSNNTSSRIHLIFKTLLELQQSHQTTPSLSLSYLNVLLEEFNLAYFSDVSQSLNTQEIGHFMDFKEYIYQNLTFELSIEQVAQELGISSSLLYKIVKKSTQQSPKQYLASLLVIEAQRRLLYSPISVKELAYDLGFSDPSYFSRFFKKYTGKSIRQFITDLSI
ncbi:MAG TPA: hypothetical protein DCS93_38185 [Microscillaceae bacterium]|nr:hypothetical protein [Microscillaceae bacterium]